MNRLGDQPGRGSREFYFLADALALDFLNTTAIPGGDPVEQIPDGESLLGWLVVSRLIEVSVAEDIREMALPAELDAIAVQARSLRSWFTQFVRRHSGCSLRPELLPELSPLNKVLERDNSFSIVVSRQDHHASGDAEAWDVAFQRQVCRHWREPGSLLLPLAQAMAELVCTADFLRIRQCEAPECSLFFLDTSRAGARRWCSMAVCGNRAKQAAHRDRIAQG